MGERKEPWQIVEVLPRNLEVEEEGSEYHSCGKIS